MVEIAFDEISWIQSAQNGDLSAFNELIPHYQNAVYNLAYRIMGDEPSADDATQEAFINAYRKIASYQGGSFRAWLLRIVANTCNDELRRRKRRPAVGFEDLPLGETDDGPPLPSKDLSPEDRAQQSELNQAIQECLNKLSDDQRAVVVMSDIEGYEYQEIADTLDVQMGTVKSRLSRARLALRKCLTLSRELLPSNIRL